MAGKLRHFTKRVIIYIHFFVIALFLLACLSPYLNPKTWWLISFLGLAFPFLLLLIVIFLIAWSFLKKRYALYSVTALIIGIKSIGILIAFHLPHVFNYNRTPNTIRIVSWNVARFIEIKKVSSKGSQTRLKMMELLKEQNADVLCLQEFQSSGWAEYYDNISYVKQELHYPYFYFCFDEDGDKQFYSSIIFSRYPIIDSSLIRYPRPTLPDLLLHADIKVNNDTVRIYTTHLQSLQFKKSDYDKINKIERIEDSLLYNSRRIVSKIKRGFINRGIQANIIHDVVENSPHPVLFCADLNDVPNSYTYHKVRNEMQDAFLKKGFGIGRTFSSLSPTLRIDYIFADDHFRIKQFNRIIKNYSDHYMLVADVELKK
jgi:endonuclease/exonuclease/phosphatase family metal-dependent hydrolase